MKKNYKNILYVLYAILFIPNFYAIYYSVPASDDFAMTLGREGYGNVFSEFFAMVHYFWTQRGGTIFAFIAEVVFSPLNLHRHLGHFYGVYMICFFVICMACIIYAIKTVVSYILKTDKNSIVPDVITFMITVVLLQNYYYVETYNWYVGMIGYALNMAILFLAYAYIVKYAETGEKKYWIGMIIFGIIASNITAQDVPLGIFFLYIVVVKKGFDAHISSWIKRFIPLGCYVLTGIITLLAPGNYVRQQQYTEDSSLFVSIRQSVADIVFYGKAIVFERPFTFIVAVVLLIIGIGITSKTKAKPGNVIVFAIASFIVWLGCLLPYVYGRNLTRTILDVRMQYYLDYFITISICLIALMAGQWIGYIVKAELAKQCTVAASVVFALGIVALIVTGRYTTTVAYEVYAKSNEIKVSYVLWDGILAEIEASPQEDVVVARDWNVPWNKYFLYSGMEPGEEYAVPLDAFYDSEQILPNVYYKKNSITIYYPR